MLLVFNLLLAHIIGDFFLQTGKMCDNKRNRKLKGWGIYVHLLFIFLLSWLASWQWEFWWMALILAVLHIVVDCGKICAESKIKLKTEDGGVIELGDSNKELIPFIIDQIVHWGLLFFVAQWWQGISEWQQTPVISSIGFKYYLIFFAIVVCWRPSNILIRLILKYFKVKEIEEDEHGNFKSGGLIGTTERWLILCFVLLGQYEAIGFLVAAKSILRFSEVKGSEKSEYVLAGTLLSMSLALVFGIIIVKFF